MVVGGINISMQKRFRMIVQNGHFSHLEIFGDASYR